MEERGFSVNLKGRLLRKIKFNGNLYSRAPRNEDLPGKESCRFKIWKDHRGAFLKDPPHFRLRLIAHQDFFLAETYEEQVQD